MKKIQKVTAIFLIMAAFAFVLPPHSIVGRWKTYGSDGSFGYVYFDQNGTFKVVTPDGTKILHQGNYKFKNDMFSINDHEGCGDTYWGTYKLTFVNEDSFTVAVVNDSCTGRRQDITTGNVGLHRANAK